MSLAVVTGASSGIGAALAHELAGRGYPLLLTGRNGSALAQVAEKIRARYGISVESLAADLATEEGLRQTRDALIARGREITHLVNNAGLGTVGAFAISDGALVDAMIAVNIRALTSLTHAVLPAMIDQSRGKIMNVASTAAFQPGPNMAVYFATKAYVLSFSQALAREVRGTGVSVTALCPGPTDTAFGERSGIGRTLAFRIDRPADASAVARFGIAAMERGQAVAIHGIRNAVLARLAGIAPRRLVNLIVHRLLSG